ncbi:Uncharacterized protein HZ326_25318 [Fusarium oxysporum f. sp. albedinis]|nr:Uncharacterized protein HZ326_25318 [Fusarium oxysporum f. sp. albedinis]
MLHLGTQTTLQPWSQIPVNRVASTLFNAVKARVDYVKTNGVGPAAPPLYTAMDWQHHGLVGPVMVKSLRRDDL